MLPKLDKQRPWSDKIKRKSSAIQEGVTKVSRLQQELLEFLSVSQDTISFTNLSEEYLNRVISILSITQELVPTPENQNSEYSLRVFKRLVAMRTSDSVNDILSVDELLEQFIETIEKKLKIESVKLPFTIYPPNHTTVIQEWDESSEEFNEQEPKQVPKFSLFLHILNEKWISFDSIMVLEEDEELLRADNRMRVFPYKIIYLRDWDIEKTILISDELWQATFVYEWIIREDNFADFSKWEGIESVIPEKVVFWTRYWERLDKAIFTKRESLPEESWIYINLSWWELDIEKEKAVYRNLLIESREELQEVWILSLNWIWYFSDALPALKWPLIWWKTLRSFPSLTFNKQHKLWSTQWQNQSWVALSRLFSFLWFRVASKEEEESRLVEYWKELLINNKYSLESAWIFEEEWKWYFYHTKAMKFWPEIWWKKLRNFPNSAFIRWVIGEEKDSSLNSDDLKSIFWALGLNIATKKDEKEKIIRDWVKKLIENREELETYGISYLNGCWDLSNLKEGFLSVDIWWIKLRNFPNIVFNRDYNIWWKDGRLTPSMKSIRSMLEWLGQKII